MASLTKTATGWRIQWTDGAGNRKSLRFGELKEPDANTMKTRIERLVLAASTGDAPTPEIMTWLKALQDRPYAKLAAVGLVHSREASKQWTLGELLTTYFANLNVKKGTVLAYTQARVSLVQHFKEQRALAAIGPMDAEGWVKALRESELAPATQAKRVKIAKAIFARGVRWSMIPASPFADIKGGSQRNQDRAAFVLRETIAKVLNACPDAEWRCIVALARYGGLRCPSEHQALRWADVDWDSLRLRVRSCKTEHHEGGAERFVPIFPELLPHLRAAFENASEGSLFVVSRYRGDNANLRTQFLRIIDRAGVKPWDRLFQNLRASRQTELAAEFPLADVCSWLGNSPAVALSHYVQSQDCNFVEATRRETGGAKSGAQVVQSGVNSTKVQSVPHVKENSQPLADCTFGHNEKTPALSVQGSQVGAEGFEPP